jgi:hypothetical protein
VRRSHPIRVAAPEERFELGREIALPNISSEQVRRHACTRGSLRVRHEAPCCIPLRSREELGGRCGLSLGHLACASSSKASMLPLVQVFPDRVESVEGRFVEVQVEVVMCVRSSSSGPDAWEPDRLVDPVRQNGSTSSVLSPPEFCQRAIDLARTGQAPPPQFRPPLAVVDGSVRSAQG